MATRAYLQTKGLAEYIENLQAAGKDIDQAAQRALGKGAVILQDEMQNLVPVDEGNLQAHIVIEGPFQEGNFSYVEVSVVNADAKTAIIGNVQEYGSPSKNIAAQPYIRPAIDRKRAAVLRTMRESFIAEGLAD